MWWRRVDWMVIEIVVMLKETMTQRWRERWIQRTRLRERNLVKQWKKSSLRER
jgi:hypothetical protein